MCTLTRTSKKKINAEIWKQL